MVKLCLSNVNISRVMRTHASSSDVPMASAADYVKMNGVKPYFFDFKCNVKGRWAGKTMLDVFLLEFPARNTEYWEEAFADGRLRVTSGKAGLHDPLKVGMTMQHYIHRHEPPVVDVDIPVLGLAEDVVAVGKPASMPVHVSGQYRKNTVLSILQAERPELGNLLPIHRLDKSVSGVLLFARSPQAAENARKLIEGSQMQKSYVARVLGVFPEGFISAKAGLAWDPKFNHVTAVDEGMEKDASGRAAKPSCTDFERIAVAPDGRTSLVKCWPRTGRTHQIRVHLQWLGHPIANDLQYGGPYKGPRPAYLIPGTAASERLQVQQKATETSSQPSKRQRLGSEWQFDRLEEETPAEGNSSQQPGIQDKPEAGSQRIEATTLEALKLSFSNRGQNHRRRSAVNNAFSDLEHGWLEGLEVPEEHNDAVCLNCPKWVPSGYPVELSPLWLHAVEYSCDAWTFLCPPPQWSAADWAPPETH